MAEALVHDAAALTPIQRVEPGIWLKRDDLLEIAGVRGGKLRTCWHLASGAPEGLVTAGSRSSPQVNIVAHLARELGIPCRVHVPSGEIGPELRAAAEAGAEIVQHRAGRNSLLVARSRKDAEARGWTLIPFGMDCADAIEETRRQVKRIPRGAKRVVVAVGFGMTLASILHGLRDRGREIPVLGVRVGADPTRRLDRHAPDGWRSMVHLVEPPGDYARPAEQTERWGVAFDPYYEAKALPYVETGDLLWVVGIRQTAIARSDARAPSARTIQGGKTSVVRSPNGLAEVRLSDARDLQVDNESARLVVGASVFLGKRAQWADYEALYRRVYVDRCIPTIRRDGYFVLIQTDAYVAGKVVPRNAIVSSMLLENGLELIDRKVWKRRRADHFQPPFSEVFVYRRAGGSATRTRLVKHGGYFQGVWDYPQLEGGPLAAYPPGLCRMLVEAFTDDGDLIVDPFAGTARLLGIAAQLGRRAIGYEIDEELIETIQRNLAEGEAPKEDETIRLDLEASPAEPTWIVGDARKLSELTQGEFDLVFTCPPYYDLEQYSDDPADLSAAASYEEFLEAWSSIVADATERLRADRFFVVVVGEIREKMHGAYRGFVSDTIRAAEAAGLHFYNDAVLVTPHGSLPVRAARTFESSRKLGKTHQNVLVFVKGDWKRATRALGGVEFGRGEELTEDELAPPVV